MTEKNKITTIQIMVEFAKKLFIHFLADEPSLSGLTAFVKHPEQATWDSAEADILAQAIMFMYECDDGEQYKCGKERIKFFIEFYNGFVGPKK